MQTHFQLVLDQARDHIGIPAFVTGCACITGFFIVSSIISGPGSFPNNPMDNSQVGITKNTTQTGIVKPATKGTTDDPNASVVQFDESQNNVILVKNYIIPGQTSLPDYHVQQQDYQNDAETLINTRANSITHYADTHPHPWTARAIEVDSIDNSVDI